MLPQRINTSPLGILDSGVGGLSVWNEMTKLLPHEGSIYYADSAFCPYGSQPVEAVIARCERITEFLMSKECKLVILACNTATAAAIDYLRAKYKDISFVGMEPAVKQAAMYSSSGKIGVLATQGTFKGKLYNKTAERFATNVQIIERTGDGLVELIESGNTDGEAVIALLQKYINPMLDAGIDHLVLGCTHYPFLIPAIQKIVGNRVTILDPAAAVAKRVQFLLNELSLANTSKQEGSHLFFSSGNPEILHCLLQRMGIQSIPKQQDL